MSPELEQAVRERIELGHSKDQITAELHTAGYEADTIESVYVAVSGAVASGTTVAAIPFTRARDLIKLAWTGMTSRLDLVGLIAVPGALLVLLAYVNETQEFAVGAGAAIVAVIVAFLFVVVMIALQIAVVHAAVTTVVGAAAAPALADSVRWARQNILSFVWLMILSFLVIYGGLMLFIIPGIIALIYIFVAQYSLVHEGTKGMSALQRSRQLVSGNAGPVVWRLFIMMLFLIAVYIPVGIAYGILGFTEDTTYLIPDILEALLSAAVGVFATFYVATMYRDLLQQPVSHPKPTVWYTVYGWIGVAMFAGLIVFGAFVATQLDSAQWQAIETREGMLENQAVLDAELEAFQAEFQAEFEAY
jgi:hypothetical protein